MDIFAHTIWANGLARGANKIAEKKKKKFRIHPGWAGFWGVFPDFFAFTIPFIIGIFKMLKGEDVFSRMRHHELAGGFDLAAYLYQYSHSLVVWAFVFCVVWFFSKRPRFELLGWALHILIDIPSHTLAFYATPFLFPISDYRFPYGVSWANFYYMIINYSLLLALWLRIFWRKKKG